MPKKKLQINVSESDLEKLYGALSVGTPISIACSMVGISLATYYYWVAIYSVVVDVKEQEQLEELERLSKVGISIQEIKELAASQTQGHKKSAVGTYIEPSQESILQYKNSIKFRKFADQVYEIINKCNQIRSRVVVKHLDNISKSTTDKKIKASGSMWFLERTQTDYFGRTQDKVIEEETTPSTIPSIQVEFIDPGTTDNKDRLLEMEQKVLQELKGSGEA